MIFLKYFVIIILTFNEIYADYCLSNDDNPYKFFSTRTPYQYIRGNEEAETTCEPIQMWIINRHGTRYPQSFEIPIMKKSIKLKERLIANYESGLVTSMSRLCINDYIGIKNWIWDKSIELNPSFLNEQGWKDLYGIAKRFRFRYPSILSSYNPEDFYFRHTKTQRTLESCKAFIDGLFGEGSHKSVTIEKPQRYDSVIGPQCKLWNYEVFHKPTRRDEQSIFRKSSDYLELLYDVTIRMGFTELLEYEDIRSMYDNCRYDKSRFLNRTSPWCAVFTKKQLMMLEYHDDLGRYYESGYGHPLNPKLGCMPFRHLLETFSKTTADFKGKVIGPKVVAMFSHDTILNFMSTAMRFAKDQHELRGIEYDDFLINRKFRTSQHTPFAANIVAVLHHCGPEENEPFKVQFFLNEKQMMLPGCVRGLCGWEHLQQYYASVFDCNLDFCKNDLS